MEKFLIIFVNQPGGVHSLRSFREEVSGLDGQEAWTEGRVILVVTGSLCIVDTGSWVVATQTFFDFHPENWGKMKPF